ncbi:MAG: hypothetical protein A2X99_03025 [Deltaproteobacteria bacterium GWB2_55_19]|nr:MAG: hypothetical protein A2X99_03025 [Deltaproteobacteria bacterium GWB2_55_19]HAO94349.1 hypothetical protein [Deltaproteobacteria bacterium]
MPKILALILFVALSFAWSPAPVAAEDGASANAKTIKTIEQKMKTNTAFLKAAAQVIDAGGKEAASFLKMAEMAAGEAEVHYKKGEYEFAIEDISESTHLAMSAIILSKNQQDGSIRDVVIKEELVLKEKREIEKKEAMIRKSIDEVEIFIRTAEKLLARNANDSAGEKLKETKALYDSAKKDVAAGRMDNALDGLGKAYMLATAAVKEIKRSQNDIITFPKPAVTDEAALLAYELNKNNSYVYFAAQVVTSGKKEPSRLLDDGMALKDEATGAIEKGDNGKAIELLKASTETIIRAIKAASE